MHQEAYITFYSIAKLINVLIPLQGIVCFIAYIPLLLCHAMFCVHPGSPQFDDIFEQCSKAVLPGHALLLTMHIINHTVDVEIKDEKVCIFISEVISVSGWLSIMQIISCEFNQIS